MVHTSFNEQFITWIPRFTILRARLLLLPFIIPLPAYGLILRSTFATHRQAEDSVLGNTLWLSRLIVLPA